MPNRKNAVLQMKKDAKKRERNAGVKAKLKTERKNFETLIKTGDKEKTDTAFKGLISVIDKTAKKGVIPKGRASRIKSRYAAKVSAL